MLSTIIVSLIFNLITPQSPSAIQPLEEVKIQWISLEDVESKIKSNPKPILIDFYTDWCGWCKRLDADTYSNPDVINYINANFYPVKFNGEQRTEANFMGKKYTFQPSGNKGTNQFALKFAVKNNRIGYPTTTLVDGDGKVIIVEPGYKNAENMLVWLKYYGDGHYKNMTYTAYQSQLTQPEIMAE